MRASLRNLRTDVIDLYYFQPLRLWANDEYFDDALAVMRRFRDEGKIRFIGLSDWDGRKIMKFIERADPDAVQPYRNVIDDDYESSGLKAWVESHDLGVAFFSPLKHGLLLGSTTSRRLCRGRLPQRHPRVSRPNSWPGCATHATR